MDIKLVDKGETGELLLIGRLDSVTAPETEDIVMQMTDRYGTLILNMEQLDYLSSAGLRILKKAHVAMKKKGGELILTNVNDMIQEVFEMTGFAGILTIQ